MAEDTPTVFGSKAVEQLARAVRDNEHRMMLPRGQRGRWQFHGGGGATSYRIYFEIASYDCISDTEVEITVTVLWFTGGCTADIPGSYGETVVVKDPCGILLFYPAATLPGKTGFATYMYPRTGDCEPKWLLDDICGTPECV